jgi:hypothetical protein
VPLLWVGVVGAVAGEAAAVGYLAVVVAAAAVPRLPTVVLAAVGLLVAAGGGGCGRHGSGVVRGGENAS